MNAIVGKFRQLLLRKQKIHLVFLGILMVIGAFLETFSVSLIIPLISVIMDESIIETNELARSICQLFRLENNREFVLLIVIALIVMFFIKNAFLFLEYYLQYRFIYNNRFYIQKKLLNIYLNKPYEYYLHINSGEIVRNVNQDVANTFALLTNVLGFYTEIFVAVFLVIMLFCIDFVMTLMVAVVLAVSMLVISYLLKPKLRSAAENMQESTAQSNKWLLQSITGIKEIKVTKKEKVFLDTYIKYGQMTIDSEKINSVLTVLPRLLIETITICGMLSIIYITLINGRGLAAMIPQLSAFGMAAVRLIPSANRLSNSYNMASFMEPAIDKVLMNMKEVEDWNANIDKKENALSNGKLHKKEITESIEAKNLTYAYPGTETNIFQDAYMKIPAGKSVGIVGVSGAGKTTVVDILLGLLKPKQGVVLADGVNIQEDYEGWLGHIGYIPQMIFLLDDTIRANVAFGVETQQVSDEQLWKVLKEAQLEEFVKKLPNGLDTTIGERGVRLSGGQRQRIGIARALYPNPDVLVFDEATSALDNDTEAAIMEAVEDLQGEKTIIIIAHRLKTIENCDFIYTVEGGEIRLSQKRE